MKTYFKVLDPGGACRNGGHGKWHLPKGGRPGKWMPRVPNPNACVRGYHVCTISQLPNWLGPEIWIVEVRGKCDNSKIDKSCHEQARIISATQWNETNARLFAADCAEHVLPLFEKVLPNDKRPREAIAVVRRFAVGQATQAELAAARDAARAAAWDAARADAARADAAGDAARDAAGAAAWDAARAAAWDAARDAAGGAAGAAARAAARAAAGDAAWGAAGAAAWNAARDAERRWQSRRLRSYLTGSAGRKHGGGK